MLSSPSRNESRTDGGGNEAGAEVEGLMKPDPDTSVGEARPAGREAARMELSAVEDKPF